MATSCKITVLEANVLLPRLPLQIQSPLCNVYITVQEVKRELEDLDVPKSVICSRYVSQPAGHTTCCIVPSMYGTEDMAETVEDCKCCCNPQKDEQDLSQEL